MRRGARGPPEVAIERGVGCQGGFRAANDVDHSRRRKVVPDPLQEALAGGRLLDPHLRADGMRPEPVCWATASAKAHSGHDVVRASRLCSLTRHHAAKLGQNRHKARLWRASGRAAGEAARKHEAFEPSACEIAGVTVRSETEQGRFQAGVEAAFGWDDGQLRMVVEKVAQERRPAALDAADENRPLRQRQAAIHFACGQLLRVARLRSRPYRPRPAARRVGSDPDPGAGGARDAKAGIEPILELDDCPIVRPSAADRHSRSHLAAGKTFSDVRMVG